jgi:TRAP-type C4-dicarboxylate transport system permease small subunit
MSIKQFEVHQVSPVLSFPLGLIYTFVFFGMLLSVVRVVMEIVKIVKDLKREGDADIQLESLKEDVRSLGGDD